MCLSLEYLETSGVMFVHLGPTPLPLIVLEVDIKPMLSQSDSSSRDFRIGRQVLYHLSHVSSSEILELGPKDSSSHKVALLNDIVVCPGAMASIINPHATQSKERQKRDGQEDLQRKSA
jgi:hypothetical protein